MTDDERAIVKRCVHELDAYHHPNAAGTLCAAGCFGRWPCDAYLTARELHDLAEEAPQ